MMWLIAWIVLSVPFTLFIAAFISFGGKDRNVPDHTYELDSGFHEQTFVG
jgi:hypothetical protein